MSRQHVCLRVLRVAVKLKCYSSELVDLHPTVAALAGIPFTQPMPLGSGPEVPRFNQAFGTDLSPLFEQ